MSVANLTNTTWLINETINATSWLDEGDLFFISNGNEYVGMYPDNNNLYYYDDLGNDIKVYDASSYWVNQNYRTVKITGGYNATSSNAIAWLEANAIQILPSKVLNMVGGGLSLDSLGNNAATDADIISGKKAYSDQGREITGAMPTGIATSPETISGSAGSTSVSNSTLTLSGTVPVTPVVTTAGYITTGTEGNSTVSLSTSAQNLIPGNIKNGVNLFGVTGTYGAVKKISAPDSISTTTIKFSGVNTEPLFFICCYLGRYNLGFSSTANPIIFLNFDTTQQYLTWVVNSGNGVYDGYYVSISNETYTYSNSELTLKPNLNSGNFITDTNDNYVLYYI